MKDIVCRGNRGDSGHDDPEANIAGVAERRVPPLYLNYVAARTV